MKSLKKILILSAALSILCYNTAKADIIFYKDGKIKGDVKSQEITLKLCSVSDDVLRLDRDKILGIKVDEKGSLEVLLKDNTGFKKDDTGFNTDRGYSSTSDCLKIRIKDGKGNEKTIRGEEIKKYLFTNNIVLDKEIIKKYEFIKVAGEYFKKLGLTPGESFSLYRDDIKEKYILVSIDKLKLATNYRNLQIKESFDKKEVESLEKQLKAEGKDTFLGIVASAGCSLTPPFVKYSMSRFAEPLFHEWWHENIGDLPLELNEATATVIGVVCAEDFLLKHPKYKKWYEDVNVNSSKMYSMYSKIIVEYYEKLSKIYNSEMPDEQKLKSKEQILGEMEEKTGYKMSNAELSFAITYFRYFDLADKVIKHYKNLKDAAKALKNTPADNLEGGIKYLEKLLDVEVEKPKLESYF